MRTYDPDSMYKPTPGAEALYFAAGSEARNRAHHVGTGCASRENYAVVYNLPGHPNPFGAPAAQATALVTNALAPPAKRP